MVLFQEHKPPTGRLDSPTHSGAGQPLPPCARPGCPHQARPRAPHASNGRFPKYCSTTCEYQARKEYEQARRELARQRQLCRDLEARVASFGRRNNAERREAEVKAQAIRLVRKLIRLKGQMKPDTHRPDAVYLELAPLLRDLFNIQSTRN